MDGSFLHIFFRSKGGNSDTWHIVQVRSAEKLYNQVILGDWAESFLGESNFDQIGAIGKRTWRTTIGRKFIPWRSKILDIKHIQDRDAKSKKKNDSNQENKNNY